MPAIVPEGASAVMLSLMRRQAQGLVGLGALLNDTVATPETPAWTPAAAMTSIAQTATAFLKDWETSSERHHEGGADDDDGVEDGGDE
jgi:hypothetical protein